ncbi:unnamed protein product [Prunus armeniaca]
MEAQRSYPRIVPKDYTKTAISFELVLRFFLHRTLPNGKAALRLVGTHNSKPCRRKLAKAKSGSEWVTAQRRTPSFRKHSTSLSNTIVNPSQRWPLPNSRKPLPKPNLPQLLILAEPT